MNIEYFCLDCKRNICNKCFYYHKSHKYYYNKKYISEEEFNKINNNLEISKKNIEKNMKLINEKINKNELELNELKLLYEKYKNINDKLNKFCNYIFKLYKDLYKNKKDIRHFTMQ